MQTGKDRKVVGTYACNNRNNHGARICRNQNVRQQPLEELVLRKIEETVFDESRIPDIVRAYRELSQQEEGEDKDKIRTLRQNRKPESRRLTTLSISLPIRVARRWSLSLPSWSAKKSCWMFRFRRRNEAPRKVN